MISFMVCGAQKSGTSALHEYLREHPEISLSKTKELHIFDNENRDWTTKGIEKIDNSIKKYYEKAKDYKIKGDSTPASMWWRPAMGRIWQYNPNMKLIAILRNPVERAYANWKMEHNKGRESRKLQLSFEEEEERCRIALPGQHKIFSYLSRGLYSEQIRRIWQYFPRKNLLLIRQEELKNNPEETLEDVYKHLGVTVVKFKGVKEIISWNSERKGKVSDNKNKIPDKPSIYIENALKKLYKQEIRTLEDMTGWDCSNWYN